MPEADAVLVALQMAIQTEIDGYNFYQRFAESADPRTRDMFERLARDEIMHLELLQSTKVMLEERGEWGEYKRLSLDSSEGAPIFSRERVEQNIVDYASDMSALRMAYLIERDAVVFYTQASKQTKDPNGQRMFLDLAKMEQRHLDLLESEYQVLRDQFQVAAGFAPF